MCGSKLNERTKEAFEIEYTRPDAPASSSTRAWACLLYTFDAIWQALQKRFVFILLRLSQIFYQTHYSNLQKNFPNSSLQDVLVVDWALWWKIWVFHLYHRWVNYQYNANFIEKGNDFSGVLTALQLLFLQKECIYSVLLQRTKHYYKADYM